MELKEKINFGLTSRVAFLIWSENFLLQKYSVEKGHVLTCYRLKELNNKWEKYYPLKSLNFCYTNGDKVGVNNNINKTFEINLNTGNEIKNFRHSIKIKINDYFITSPVIEGKARDICYDYESGKEIWQHPPIPIFIPQYIKDDIFIGFPKRKSLSEFDFSYFLHADIKTGKTLWTFDCQQLGKYSHKKYPNAERKWHNDEVLKMIGVYENNLWVVMYSGKVIGIDVATGHLQHTIDLADEVHGQLFESWYKANEFKGWTWRILLKKEEGILYGGVSHYYYEIDLKQEKPHFVVWELPENNPNVEGGQVSEPLTATHFFYADNHNGWVCALNRTTLAIDWKHQFHNRREGYFREIKYIDNRLYVLHGEYTGERHHYLYVFEPIS